MKLMESVNGLLLMLKACRLLVSECHVGALTEKNSQVK